MKARLHPGVALAITVAALVLVLCQFRLASEGRRNLASMEEERAQARREIRSLQRDRDQFGKEADAIRRSFVAERPKDRSPAEKLRIEQDKRVSTIRAWLALKDAALYHRLQLRPEQIESLERLAVDRWLRVQDILATAAADGLPSSDPAIGALRKEEKERYYQQVGDLLGQPAAAEVSDYDRTEGARAFANSVAGNVFATEPLTGAQAEQLTQIIASNSAAYQKGGNVAVVGGDLNFTAVQSQARAVLTPGQFAALQSIYQASDAFLQLNKILAAQEIGAPPGSAAGGAH